MYGYVYPSGRRLSRRKQRRLASSGFGGQGANLGLGGAGLGSGYGMSPYSLHRRLGRVTLPILGLGALLGIWSVLRKMKLRSRNSKVVYTEPIEEDYDYVDQPVVQKRRKFLGLF